jgi:hypothetical protein
MQNLIERGNCDYTGADRRTTGRGIFIFIVIIFVIVFLLGRELFRIVTNRLLINTRI